MRFLIALLFLVGWSVNGAPGSFIGANVETNGWVLDITWQGMATQGVFNAGLRQPYRYPSIGSNFMVTLDLVDMGFDSSGSAITRPRRIYGTRTLRLPIGSTNDYQAQGSNTLIRIALSDWVYAASSNLVLSISSNIYTSSLTNSFSVLSDVNTTNSSTNIYPKPIAKFIVPDGIKYVGTATVACVAFGHHPVGDGTPGISCVKFWGTDSSGHFTTTQTVSKPSIFPDSRDAVPVIEYRASYSIVGLNHTNKFTNHFQVFPSIGSNTLYTGDGRYSRPANECVPLMSFADTNNSYTTTYALVDLNGNDSTGFATNSFNPSSPPKPFLTFGGAATALGRTNFYLYGHSDCGGSVIYVTNGQYKYTGSSATVTNLNPTYCLITTYPGSNINDVTITNTASDNNIHSSIIVSNITISSLGSSPFSNTEMVWIDSCIITNSATNPTFSRCTNFYFTRNLCRTNFIQGLVQVGTDPLNVRLIRGNDFRDCIMTYTPTVVLGNLRTSGTNGAITCGWVDSTSIDATSYPIIAFNKFLAQKISNVHMISLNEPNKIMKITNGMAIVQNEFENVNGGDSSVVARILTVADSNSSNDDTNPCNNVIIWNNTLVGQRFNVPANAGGTKVAERQLCSFLNNNSDQVNVKTDQNLTPNAARIGDWPISFGVNFVGNTDLDPGIGPFDNGGWNFDFLGIASLMNTNFGGSGSTNFGPGAIWAVYTKFVNRQSALGDTNITVGGGNYRLQSVSPHFGIPTKWALPFDIEGHSRSAIDPPGAYSAGNVKKGAFF